MDSVSGAPARRLLLFDDARARQWTPFSATRPVGELLFGDRRLRERVERWAGVPCSGHLCGSRLAGWDEPGAPRALAGAGWPDEAASQDGVAGGASSERAWSERASSEQASSERAASGAPAGTLYWLSRAVPSGPRPEFGPLPVTLADDEGVVGWWLPPGTDPPDATALERPDSHSPGPLHRVETRRLGWPWHLIEANADQLRVDLGGSGHTDAFQLEPGTWTVGDHPIVLGPRAQVGPGVVLDVREGPIRLDAGVRVEGPARLIGPLHLGPGTQVFGGHLARISTGPTCKLRGEIADSVLLGYDNKAHDGYLGHALLGRWVNLGAGTTNSDLKNNYGSVRVDLGHGPLDSGLQKVGVLLGDHVKTGIGTLLTTGGVVGAGSNVFGGGGIPPRLVAPFSWGGPLKWSRYEWPAFVDTARRVMARRDQDLTPGVAAVLERLWHGVAEAG
jgi:UDP-N-acetylglucosamine diphosphorylase/glucosamine-1-phosphate N-acetyltransferase